ncbi:hypothetical protein CO046_02520 [Candidatus Peregrinibacteria bacterium CG_4_9_14_0_2_um_filter_53_11]|nr:MAG: hypothetical protein CO046_02520 [Candidatus Peregrinibacteria bacterium CG_4_9_14_0_2_um_filter_53_11]
MSEQRSQLDAILLVDDEPLARMIAQARLNNALSEEIESGRVRVAEADGLRTAIGAVRELASKLIALVGDLQMPGTSQGQHNEFGATEREEGVAVVEAALAAGLPPERIFLLTASVDPLHMRNGPGYNPSDLQSRLASFAAERGISLVSKADADELFEKTLPCLVRQTLSAE